MSAISSASSSAQTTLLQQLQQRGAPGQFGGAQFEARRKADFSSALQAAGVDSSKVDDIQKQIDAAVQNVRQNGASGTDPRAAVKSAVQDVLTKNGVDVSKFEAALKANHAKRGHGAKKAGGDGDGDADDGGSAASVNESSESGSSSQSSTVSAKFADLLKSLASGTTQQSSVANLPAGSLLDVAA